MTTDVTAKLRFLRISPRKVRLVLNLIRGKDVVSAEALLQHLPKRSSHPILKLLKSAQANAEHNFKIDPTTLFIRQAFADEGPKLKRYEPHAMGRATVVMKRSSHVTVVLAQREKLEKKHMATKPQLEKSAKKERQPKKPTVRKEKN